MGNRENTKDGDRENEIDLVYTRSEWMSADIYTKHFKEKGEFMRVKELINITTRDKVEDLIRKRRIIYQRMEEDILRHPNNVRRHKGSSATARYYEKGFTGQQAGKKGVEEANRKIMGEAVDEDHENDEEVAANK